MTYGEKGEVFTPYAGYDSTEPGYMAATKATRNISAPNPFICRGGAKTITCTGKRIMSDELAKGIAEQQET